MHSSNELAELADLEPEVVEDAFEAADRLIPTSEWDPDIGPNDHQFDVQVTSVEDTDVIYRMVIRDDGRETELYSDPDNSIGYRPALRP